MLHILALGLQIAPSRSHLYTLGPKVSAAFILGTIELGPRQVHDAMDDSFMSLRLLHSDCRDP